MKTTFNKKKINLLFVAKIIKYFIIFFLIIFLSYLIYDDLNDIASSGSPIFTNLVASDYSLWSVDTNDCYSDTLFGVTLSQPAKIYIDTNSVKVTDVSCFSVS